MNHFSRILSAAAVCVCVSFSQSFASAEALFTITDMVGRKVAFEKNAEKIVTTFKPSALCVLSLGLSENLVAIDSHSKHDRLQLAVAPRIADLPGVGTKTTGLNLETILQNKPDLVLLYAQKDGIQIADRLLARGIATLVVVPETFDDLSTALRMIAKAVGAPEKAERVIRESDRLLHLVANRVKQIPEGQRKVVYYGSAKGIFSTTTGNLLQDVIIQRGGGINASHDLEGYFREISPEQFIQWNPDFVVVSKGAGAQATMLGRQQFKQIRAVANDQVYLFPSDLAPWDFPSPLSTLGVLWMGKRLYPDLFKDLDLNAEINQFHRVLFGKGFTEMGGHLADRIK